MSDPKVKHLNTILDKEYAKLVGDQLTPEYFHKKVIAYLSLHGINVNIVDGKAWNGSSWPFAVEVPDTGNYWLAACKSLEDAVAFCTDNNLHIKN